jgi:branched-chain amino acid transport system permease protein
MSRTQIGTVLLSGGLVVLAVFPFVASAMDAGFFLAFAARVLIYAIAATALNIALGMGGMVSLGHALFLGLGMYSVALPSHFGLGAGWVHLSLAVASCALVGTISGWVSLRTKGIAFIMITLAFAQMGYFIFVSLKQFGGDDGMAVANPSTVFGMSIGTPGASYVCALTVLVLLISWVHKLRTSPFGMALRAARQNERRAASVGISVRRYQLAAYVMSAVVCGVAGMLLANLNAYASPSTMSWMTSGELIVMVVLGGMGTVLGPLVGAFVYLGLEEAMKAVTDHWMAVFGLAILAISLAGKSGIMGWFAIRTRSKRQRDARVALPVVATTEAP